MSLIQPNATLVKPLILNLNQIICITKGLHILTYIKRYQSTNCTTAVMLDKIVNNKKP